MKTNIEINGKEYLLDIDEAKKLNLLKDVYDAPAFTVGGIYSGRFNSFRLVQCIYGDNNSYQLMGLCAGASTHSDTFFHILHNKEEIIKYIENHDLKLIKEYGEYDPAATLIQK